MNRGDYHSLNSKSTYLFDSSRCSFLKSYAVYLYSPHKTHMHQSSVRANAFAADEIGLHETVAFAAAVVPRRGVRTRLCMWMVYSRATTSAMAERVVVGFLGTLGWVFGVGILDVWFREIRDCQLLVE